MLFQIWGQHKLSFLVQLLHIQILSYSWYFLFFFDPIICWNLQKVRETVSTMRLLLSDNARKFGCKPNKKKQAFPWTMNLNFVTVTYLSMKTRLKGRVLLHSQTSQLLVIHKYRHKKVCSRGKTQGEVYIHWEWSKKNRKKSGMLYVRNRKLLCERVIICDCKCD